MRRRFRRSAAAALVLFALGCSDDRGSGTLELTVTGPTALGAVSVELVGKGLVGIRQAPGYWVAESLSENTDGTTTLRAVVVSEGVGSLVVGVNVADLDDPAPEVTVLEAADGSSLPVGNVGSITAELRR